MARLFHIPGVVFLFGAFVLLLLVSISLPFLPRLTSPEFISMREVLRQAQILRMPSHSYGSARGRTAANAYYTTIYDSTKTGTVTIGSSWTRGLAIHPVAAGVTLISLLLSLSTHVTFTLLASLTAFLGSIIALIAFAVDIALFAFVKHEMGKLNGVTSRTNTAPAFWMTFVSFLLLFFAGCTVCLGRRRDRMTGATNYPMTSSKTSWRARFIKA
ncbi:hypothetical protein A0H81_05191 [Grifola frondosa]|uniref:Pali-domain-containing protein n=1 Tax=Grifola frondosa TaxID=5627 RepID=A0A1C7MCA4_GRIFR|nr:hypothetical protein A0H81_05191 [Grifola frondosa]